MIPYAGSPTSWPTAVDILSGSDLPSTTNFNTTSEGTLDRTAYLYQRILPLLQGGGSAPFFIGDISTKVDGSFTSPVITSSTFATLYVNCNGVTADARLGDIAVTIVSCALLTGGSGGSSNGGTLKLQDSQNGLALADLGLTVACAVRAANAVAPVTLIGIRSITTAGVYAVNLLGLCQFTGSGQTIAISDSGNSVGGGLQAITVLLRPTPSP